jgi:hypothetical protein
LIQWVRHRLRTGIRLDSKLLEHMQTEFGIALPENLLSDSESSETASFLELLFYPDTQTQIAFERKWGHRRFTAEAVNALLDELATEPISATIAVAGGNAPLVLQVPQTALTAFVRRLRIDWQPPPELSAALGQLGRDLRMIGVKARIRHARALWHSVQIQLVMRLVAAIPLDADDFDSCLMFTLALLPELEPEADAYEFLIARKRIYFQNLCKAEAFERQRRSSNMEILMLQGARAAYGSIAQWQRRMGRIDRICRALFGRTAFFERPMEHERCVEINAKTSNAMRDLWSDDDL